MEYAQVKNLKICGFPGNVGAPVRIDEGSYPQRTAYFETVIKGGERWETEYEFDNITVYRQPDPGEVLPVQPAFYTQEEAPHIRFTPYIRELTREAVGEEKNPLLAAEKIYRFITSEVRYSFVRSYSTIYDIPEFTAVNQKGDCGFQALLFITMCRAAGIPARWQSGLYATPLSVGCHDWAQYYVAPFGWLSADCSFGGSAFRQKDEERREYYGKTWIHTESPMLLRLCTVFPFRKGDSGTIPMTTSAGKCSARDRPFDAERTLRLSTGWIQRNYKYTVQDINMCYNSRRAVKSLQGRELQAQGTGQHKMRRFIL